MTTAVLIDGNNCLLKSYFAYPDLRSPSGAPTGAAFGVVSRVYELLQLHDPTRVVVAWDAGRAAWRKRLFPGYKERVRSDQRLDLTDCFAQKPAIEELLDVFGIGRLSREGTEADDVIAALALQASDAGERAVIVSSDRDYHQIVCDGVSVRDGSGKDGRLIEASTFEASTGWASPQKWLTYRVVNGDASDAIPRVAGLSGEKRFADVWTLLRGEMAYGGDPVEFFVDGRRPTRVESYSLYPKLWAALTALEAWACLGRNALLMDLRFAVTMLEWQAPAASIVWGTWDARRAERVCARLNFQSVVRKWSDWVRVFDAHHALADKRTNAGALLCSEGVR